MTNKGDTRAIYEMREGGHTIGFSPKIQDMRGGYADVRGSRRPCSYVPKIIDVQIDGRWVGVCGVTYPRALANARLFIKNMEKA